MNVKKELPEVKENILLKNYVTFRIGGKAKYFFSAKSKKEIIKAISTAKKLKLPFFILGAGSNVLISDKGFNGLVIRLQATGYKLHGSVIHAESGVLLSQLVNVASKNNLTGLEWASGIPGTVGGAIYGNAGAFKKSIGDSTRKIEVYDAKDNKIKIFKKQNCQFNYRQSVFKKNKNLIILSVTLQLKKGSKNSIKNKIKEYLEYRKKTQPLNFPSAGSIFKNPVPKQDLVWGKSTIFPAGELIEKCSLKGKKIGKVKISEKHANFILNLGGAKAKDVKKLINFIKKRVKNKFGIKLEEEIQYLGF